MHRPLTHPFTGPRTGCRAVAGSVALALGLLTVGCSGDTDDGTGERTVGGTGPETPTPSTSPVESSDPVTPPVTFAAGGSGEGFTYCAPRPGPAVLIQAVSVAEPVRLTSYGLDGASRSVVGSDTYVSAAPDEEEIGSYLLGERSPRGRSAADTGWAERAGLAGAELEPGTYYVFLRYTTKRSGASYDGTALAYTAGGVPASLTSQVEQRIGDC